MATQVIVAPPTSQADVTVPTISLPPSYQIQPQDGKLNASPVPPGSTKPPPLGVLSNFTGSFAGTGFNLIFRPNSGDTQFGPATHTNPLPPPQIPNPPNENVLELNLTKESLVFAGTLGSVPNRGLEKQTDILLNGVPYTQSVADVTNTVSGKGDFQPPSAIHFEPGLWMHVPATNIDPVVGESVTRMASIPHGTTINAQCFDPILSIPSAPNFKTLPVVDITPFVINSKPPVKIRFASQTASAIDTPRLPQDLTNFIAAGTITQPILDNPNLILDAAIKGQTILKTEIFTVSTIQPDPQLGGGTDNIAFLKGSSPGVGIQSGPNADAPSMTATFWIETVQASLDIPIYTPGQAPLYIQIPAADPGGQPGPVFKVNPKQAVTAPRTITVTFTQIQYMQTVLLNFAGLSWPHVSCATLIPAGMLEIPEAAFKEAGVVEQNGQQNGH